MRKLQQSGVAILGLGVIGSAVGITLCLAAILIAVETEASRLSATEAVEYGIGFSLGGVAGMALGMALIIVGRKPEPLHTLSDH